MPEIPTRVRVAPDELPRTLHEDGYRCAWTTDGTAQRLVVRLVVDGMIIGEERIWSDRDTPEARCIASRLLPVITTMCRFLSSAMAPSDFSFLAQAVDALARLPGWYLSGLDYVAVKDGGTDTLYEVHGVDLPLRVVEDRFAGFIIGADLLDWWEELAHEGGSPMPEKEEKDG